MAQEKVKRAPRKRKPAVEVPLELPVLPEFMVREDDKTFLKYDAISVDMAPHGYVVAVFLWKGKSIFTVGPFDLKPGTCLNLDGLDGRAEMSVRVDQ